MADCAAPEECVPALGDVGNAAPTLLVLVDDPLDDEVVRHDPECATDISLTLLPFRYRISVVLLSGYKIQFIIISKREHNSMKQMYSNHRRMIK